MYAACIKLNRRSTPLDETASFVVLLHTIHTYNVYFYSAYCIHNKAASKTEEDDTDVERARHSYY